MSARVPDVTVVIAVYNTMPYLTQCLASVLTQSIGADRLELIAVNDGSTDDGPAELDKWAAKYPGTVTVLHQENSGGPAGPSNRALDLATGRYVFFLGADDHLGPEALERLVGTADELDADIVLGRMVGAGGRVVNQNIYKPGNRDDIDLVNSALPWALSNTKLFRRSMLQEHGIRYPEDLRSYSDQPFTLRAVIAARRIAVRGDYNFYYAVRRTDSSNITYGTPLGGMLHDAAVIMDTSADLITDPVARHRVLRRHFTWEVGKLLGERFLNTTAEEQQLVLQGVRKLAEAYLTDEIRASLNVQQRVPLGMAQFGTVEDVAAVARHHLDNGLAPVVIDGDRTYVAYPGFRHSERGFPDEWFDATEQLREPFHQDSPAQVGLGRSADGRPTLVFSWRSRMSGPGRVESAPRLLVGDRPATTDFQDGLVRAELPLADLVAGVRRRRRTRLHFVGSVGGETFSYPVTTTDVSRARRLLYRRGLVYYLISAMLDRRGRLGVTVLPLTPRPVAGRLRSKLRRRLSSR
ncbi:MAG TPA: glycosyltransferase [Actinoplanes sp.]|nr:glycosyltransferase [Actinoplanes sp.]